MTIRCNHRLAGRRPLTLSDWHTMYFVLGLHVERRGNAWTTWEVDR